MRVLSLLLFFAISSSAVGQSTDTIRVGEPFKAYDQLDMGSFQYVVYMERGNFRRPSVMITSTTSKINHYGQQLLEITHRWTSMDAKLNGSFYSLVKPNTFEPVLHIRNTEKGKEAYAFEPNLLSGLDSATNNLEKDYNLKLDHPIFNFEIDLETFSLLPLKENYRAVLRFFHPGSTHGGPEWYPVTVEGSEKLNLPGGLHVDTWVLFMDYNGKQPTRFWYTKSGHDFIKMEADYNGTRIVKARIF